MEESFAIARWKRSQVTKILNFPALLPLLAKWHRICAEDLERWRIIAQQSLSEICAR